MASENNPFTPPPLLPAFSFLGAEKAVDGDPNTYAVTDLDDGWSKGIKSGSWKVYDMIIEGVSMVKNYRTQFRQIIAKDSPEKLLEILRGKVKQG